MANSIQVMRMCQAFADAGHDVTLFGRPGVHDGDVFDYYGVRRVFEIATCTPRKNGRVREWRYAVAVKRELSNAPPFDLVYGRHLPSVALAARNGIPFIYESHQPASRTGRLVERILFRRRNMVRTVFISEALRQAYRNRFSWLPKERTLVAHDGAPVSAHETTTGRDVSSGGRLNIGYTGSLQSGRGIDLIASLAARLPHHEFQICGGSPEEEQRCRRVYSDLRNVHIHGFRKPSEMWSWQRSMDILVAPYQCSVPTVDWMSPLKIFEYMASGIPIVASDLPVLREVLTHDKTALLVSPDNIDGWSAAVERLQDGFLRNRLALRALEECQVKFRWRLRAKNVLESFMTSEKTAAA